MKFPDHGVRFPINLDSKHCSPTPDELEKMRGNLDPLLKAVDHFPTVSLHVFLERFARSTNYRVKLSLALTGTTLVSLDDDDHIHPAFERCVRNLLAKVHAYKERLGNEPERQKQEKGTHHDLQPDLDPDAAALEQALAAADYNAFRLAILGYEEPVRKRIGRWVERYPAVSANVGKGLQIADLVEAVFLNAFAGCAQRPKDIRFGDWLERLIDPTIKKIGNGHNGDLDYARQVRTVREAEMPRD